MIRSRLKYILYPLGVYTAFIGVTHVITQHKIKQRENTTQGIEKFESLEVLGRFENPFKEYRPQTLYEFFIMRVIEIWVNEHGSLHEDLEDRKSHLGWQEVNLEQLSQLSENKNNDFMSYTWIGQSCGLVTMPNNGPRVLLDPLFENHLVSKFGPKRILPIPISLNDLMENGKPEVVIVSHDHPDHLEKESVLKIGDSCKWIVPYGVGKYLRKNGVSNIQEMKWWDKIPIESQSKDKYEIVCLPAMHWSGRIMLDANLTLWSSFLIIKNGESIFYHGGDTGYTSELFKTIGKEYGPVKFAALPIGQYCPEWHQAPRHISPMEALKICKDMKIETMAGVHWGTFVLSSEKYWEPGMKLKDISEGIDFTNAIVPKLGGCIKIKC